MGHGTSANGAGDGDVGAAIIVDPKRFRRNGNRDSGRSVLDNVEQ